jgi:hypothetical protein
MPQLLGFGISGYRSFGSEMQYFGPLGKITLLAGANNSGKSNVLSFVTKHLNSMIQKLNSGHSYAVAGLDMPRGSATTSLQFAVPIANSPEAVDALAAKIWGSRPQTNSREFKQALISLLNTKHLKPADGLAWIPFDATSGRQGRDLAVPTELLLPKI